MEINIHQAVQQGIMTRKSIQIKKGGDMKFKAAVFVMFLILSYLSAASAGSSVSQATVEQYRQVKEKISALSQTKTGKYAKDKIEAAKKSVLKAQQELEAKNEKGTKEAIEMALAQITAAEAVAEEREAAERTAVTRAELVGLEQKLADMFVGKGDAK
jgi:hypothetical protein